MKKVVALVAVSAFALLPLVAPVLAADESGAATAPATFQAFSKLVVTEGPALTPMTDEQLASITAGQVGVCVACANIAAAANVLSTGSTATTGEQNLNVGTGG